MKAATQGKLGIGTVVAALALAGLHGCASRTPPVAEQPHEPLYLGSSAMPDRAPGEYILTVAPGVGTEVLRRHYNIYGIRELTALGDNLFLIKLGNDPGLEAVQRKASETCKVQAVQPNYLFRSNR